MYVIIVGCGKVGYHLTRALLEAGEEVLVIERDSRRYAYVVDRLGSIAISGDGSEAVVLEEAGASRADVLIAVTGLDEDNLVACQIAKLKFQVPRTIALVNNPQNDDLFRKLGADVIVSHTDIILSQVEEELPQHGLVHLLPLPGSKRHLVGVQIPPDAEAAGKPLESLELPQGTIIALLVDEEGEPEVPSPEKIVQPNSEVIAVTTAPDEEALYTALTRVAVH